MELDWILIYKMEQGDDDAWESLLGNYYGYFLKYCSFHCHDQDTAEDLTQETFLRFFASLPRYRHQGKAKNYLYTIAANLCRDQAGTAASLPLNQTDSLYTDPMPDWENRLMLEEAIRRLPEEFREVILLHYYQGLKLSEIAAVLNIGPPLVKYRLKRAKELLRKETDYDPE